MGDSMGQNPVCFEAVPAGTARAAASKPALPSRRSPPISADPWACCTQKAESELKSARNKSNLPRQGAEAEAAADRSMKHAAVAPLPYSSVDAQLT